MKIIKDKISGQIHLEIDVLSVNRKLIYCSGKYLPTLGKNETVSYDKYKSFGMSCKSQYSFIDGPVKVYT